MEKPSLEVVAHHEAGHAVAAVLVGRRFHHVSIAAEADGTLGHVLYRAWDKRFDHEANWSPRTQIMLRDAVMTAYAGLAAEAKFTGVDNWAGARFDVDRAIDLATRACVSGEETEAYLRWVEIRTRDFVGNAWWKPISAVAAVLVRETHLPYLRVVEIVREARRFSPRTGTKPSA